MNLPEEIIEEIFAYLTQDEKFQVLLAVDEFKPMRSLTKTLCLNIDDHNYQEILKQEKFYKGIWLRRINISMKSPIDEISKFISRFSDSLESVGYSWSFPPKLDFINLLQTSHKLKKIYFNVCDLNGLTDEIKFTHDFKFLSLFRCTNDVMQTFVGQTIEHLELDAKFASSHTINNLLKNTTSVHFISNFEDFAPQYQNLKRCKISKFLHINKFLRVNWANLKELELDKLPHGADMKYIFEQMHLEKLTCKKTIFISNGQLQPITEINISSPELSALYEVMIHFQSIQKIVFRTSFEPLPDFAQTRTNVFSNVINLKIQSVHVYRMEILQFIQHFDNLKYLEIFGVASKAFIEALNQMSKQMKFAIQ